MAITKRRDPESAPRSHRRPRHDDPARAPRPDPDDRQGAARPGHGSAPRRRGPTPGRTAAARIAELKRVDASTARHSNGRRRRPRRSPRHAACGPGRSRTVRVRFRRLDRRRAEEADEAPRVAARYSVHRRRSDSRTARASPRCRHRMVSTLDRLRAAHPGGTIVCVSHADPIKAAVAHALGTHLDLFQRIVISPGSVTAITSGHGGPVVLTVNSTGRLARPSCSPPEHERLLRVRRRRRVHRRGRRPTRASATFFLQARAGDQRVTVKCEKQQVAAIVAVPAQGARAISRRPRIARCPVRSSSATPLDPMFVLGPIGLGYDRANDRVLVQLEELGEVDDEGEPLDERSGSRPALRSRRGQAHAFCDHADSVVAAGRPTCQWCSSPDRSRRPPMPTDELSSEPGEFDDDRRPR